MSPSRGKALRTTALVASLVILFSVSRVLFSTYSLFDFSKEILLSSQPLEGGQPQYRNVTRVPSNITNHTTEIFPSNQTGVYPIEIESIPPGGGRHRFYQKRKQCKQQLKEEVIPRLVKLSLNQLQKGPARHRESVQNAAAICLLVKNEDLYLREWVNYHLLLGFDDIYIYDDGGNTNLPSTDQVHVFSVPQDISRYSHKQRIAVNACVDLIRKRGPQYQTSIVAHFDSDEFLVLRNHDNVKDFMNDHCPPHICGSVSINWLWFGTGNQTAYSDEPIVSRFRYREANSVNTVKTIFRTEHFLCAHNPHFFLLQSDPLQPNPQPPYPYDTAGHISFAGATTRNRSFMHAASFHHYSRSIEEWYYRRCIRGDPARQLAKCTGRYPDAGDVYDDTAWQVYQRVPLEVRQPQQSQQDTVVKPFVAPYPVEPWESIDPSEIDVKEIVPVHLASFVK